MNEFAISIFTVKFIDEFAICYWTFIDWIELNWNIIELMMIDWHPLMNFIRNCKHFCTCKFRCIFSFFFLYQFQPAKVEKFLMNCEMRVRYFNVWVKKYWNIEKYPWIKLNCSFYLMKSTQNPFLARKNPSIWISKSFFSPHIYLLTFNFLQHNKNEIIHFYRKIIQLILITNKIYSWLWLYKKNLNI